MAFGTNGYEAERPIVGLKAAAPKNGDEPNAKMEKPELQLIKISRAHRDAVRNASLLRPTALGR